MARIVVPEAEAIVDQEFKVLDKGFVRLVDYMGGDERIVQAARVSYGSGTKSFRQDQALIDYLLRNEHTSPFEQVILTFHCKMPVFVARQWVRHRTARLNEISGRYSVMKDEFYVPAGEDIALQSDDNKQGRQNQAVSPELQVKVTDELVQQQTLAYQSYLGLLDDGLARELARINLPLSTYTEWYWQIDLHNLFHFLRLRMDAHAQKEIRDYAEVMYKICAAVSPMATQSFDNHLRNGLRFSGAEWQVLSGLFASKLEDSELERAAKSAGLEEKQIERLVKKVQQGRQV